MINFLIHTIHGQYSGKIYKNKNYLNNVFDGIMCIDAMENVFPENWVDVIKNFYNTLKNEGILYFTVETISKKEKDEGFSIGKKKGLPIVYGEIAHEGGYHYYPEIEYVKNILKMNVLKY